MLVFQYLKQFINIFILTFFFSTLVWSLDSTNWGVLVESGLLLLVNWLSESDSLMDGEALVDLVVVGLLVTFKQLFFISIWGTTIPSIWSGTVNAPKWGTGDVFGFNNWLLGTGL